MLFVYCPENILATSIIRFILFFSVVSCSSFSQDSNVIQQGKLIVKPPDTLGTNLHIYLHNLSDKKVGFYYYTKYYEPVEFYIEPGNMYTLILDFPSWILQLSIYQTPYYLNLSNDTLNISTNEKGIVQFKSLINKEPLIENQLNAFGFVSNHISKNENQVLLDILSKNSCRDADKIITDRYKKSKKLFDEYGKTYPLSQNFENLANAQMLLSLYSYQLFFAGDAKKKFILSPSYTSYLDSVTRVLLSGPFGISMGHPAYKTAYDYFIYHYKQKIPAQRTTELLYSNALNEIKDQKVLDKVLFFIVKDSINSNDSSCNNTVQNFTRDCHDQDYKNYITGLLADMKLKASVKVNDELLTIRNAKINFKEVLRNNYGKLIYIDTWASWCAPCREQMPASEHLRGVYKNKSIAFVFISEDNTISAWKAASEQENMNELNSNYLMVNFEKSDFKKKYNITSIPRYILIDKKGNLISVDAPRPNDPKLKPLIDTLLINN
jgi:thiol-disulfide isomerase/thioredoxin